MVGIGKKRFLTCAERSFLFSLDFVLKEALMMFVVRNDMSFS